MNPAVDQFPSSPSIHVPDVVAANGQRGKGGIRFTYNGRVVEAFEGQTVGAALMAAGIRGLRVTSRQEEPRGMFCGMGVCFDCLVQIDGRPNVRACRATVTEGMCVESQIGAGEWELPE